MCTASTRKPAERSPSGGTRRGVRRQGFPYPETYFVGVEKIREFARAIGDENPLYIDRDAARAAGYPDVVAPPTFAIAVIMKAQDELLFNPQLGLDFASSCTVTSGSSTTGRSSRGTS